MSLEKKDVEFNKIRLREKFIRDNLEKAEQKNLTEWERNFIDDMHEKVLDDEELTQRQFNKLREIAN